VKEKINYEYPRPYGDLTREKLTITNPIEMEKIPTNTSVICRKNKGNMESLRKKDEGCTFQKLTIDKLTMGRKLMLEKPTIRVFFFRRKVGN
jgi:hypothetical protein